MASARIWGLIGLAGAVALLGGCVADPEFTVAPGQGKSYADVQRDDAACRTAPASTPTTAATTPAPAGNYYQCMAARGEMVVANRTVAYPVYAYAPYPYVYPYAYPYVGYPYVGPYIGVGIGFRGGYYGGRGGYYRGRR